MRPPQNEKSTPEPRITPRRRDARVKKKGVLPFVERTLRRRRFLCRVVRRKGGRPRSGHLRSVPQAAPAPDAPALWRFRLFRQGRPRAPPSLGVAGPVARGPPKGPPTHIICPDAKGVRLPDGKFRIRVSWNPAPASCASPHPRACRTSAGRSFRDFLPRHNENSAGWQVAGPSHRDSRQKAGPGSSASQVRPGNNARPAEPTHRSACTVGRIALSPVNPGLREAKPSRPSAYAGDRDGGKRTDLGRGNQTLR